MIEKLLDPYELKARVAPGLILAFPLLAAAIYAAPALGSWPIFATGGLVSLALVYGLSHFVRARGDAIEKNLWASWGGPPSTRLMRQKDRTLAAELKALIYEAVSREFSIHLLTGSEAAKDPDRAERTIVDAFRQVRQYLRQHDANGLWSKHNIEYGFCRNLLACREIWVVIAVAATVFSAVYGGKTGGHALNSASVIGLLSLVCALYLGWAVFPQATKRTADEYAESAWMAFIHIFRKSEPTPISETDQSAQSSSI